MKFVLLLLISFAACAETYLIEGNLVYFERKDGLLLKGCQKNCKALKTINAHKTIEMKEVTKNLRFVGAPGSDVCHETYKASSLLGRDSTTKDQRAFCLFSDLSMVEINSLTDYLIKNKIIR